MTDETTEKTTELPEPVEAADAPVVPGSAVGRMTGSSGSGRVLPVVALVLAVALVVLGAINVLHVRQESPRDDVPDEVAGHVTKLLSSTPTTVSSDLKEESSWLTGDFKDEYTSLVTDTVAPAATKAGVTADAKVVAQGVESSSHDRVVLLFFVNITSTRNAAKDAETQGSRVRVVAQRVDGEWKISDLGPA